MMDDIQAEISQCMYYEACRTCSGDVTAWFLNVGRLFLIVVICNSTLSNDVFIIISNISSKTNSSSAAPFLQNNFT